MNINVIVFVVDGVYCSILIVMTIRAQPTVPQLTHIPQETGNGWGVWSGIGIRYSSEFCVNIVRFAVQHEDER